MASGAVFLITALASCHGFNLDIKHPIIFQKDVAGFGQSVVQFKESRIVVGAPLVRVSANQTGRLYECKYGTRTCLPIPLQKNSMCLREETPPPSHSDFQTQIQTSSVLDCSIAVCLKIRCDISSFRVQDKHDFTFKGNLSFDWVSQTEKILEQYEIHNPIPLSAGSTVGGLLLLLLLTAGLFKPGFFKRHYKEMIEENTQSTHFSNEVSNSLTKDLPTPK